jgi:hypothetical protein
MGREVWYPEWNSKARDVLPDVFLGNISPAQALDSLRETADRLVEEYQ